MSSAQKKDQDLMQAFVDEYNELCKKHGYQIIVTPAWRMSQDTGDWRMVLQTQIGKMPSSDLTNKNI
jgi:thiamine monophosphate synthase